MNRTYATCLTSSGNHKRAYQTKKDAKQAARAVMAAGNHPPDIYRGQCGQWHLGHSDDGISIQAKIPRALNAELVSHAQWAQVPIAEIIRAALDDYLTDHPGRAEHPPPATDHVIRSGL
jgi:hypothetical protein